MADGGEQEVSRSRGRRPASGRSDVRERREPARGPTGPSSAPGDRRGPPAPGRSPHDRPRPDRRRLRQDPRRGGEIRRADRHPLRADRRGRDHPRSRSRRPPEDHGRPRPRRRRSARPSPPAPDAQSQSPRGSLRHALPADARARLRDWSPRSRVEGLDRENARPLHDRRGRLGGAALRAGDARSALPVDTPGPRRAPAGRRRARRTSQRGEALPPRVVSVTANPFAEATARALLDAVAARSGERPAMVFGDARVTFARFRQRVESLARGLSALGIEPGDKVAIWLPNRPAWFFAQYACATIGAIVVALNPRYKAHELTYILGQSDAKALLLTDHLGGVDYFETLHEALPGLPGSVPGELSFATFPVLRHVIVDADDPYPGCHRLHDIFDLGSERTGVPRPGPRPDDTFTILYTSGTTSFPKGATITHRNCVPHGWNIGEVLR